MSEAPCGALCGVAGESWGLTAASSPLLPVPALSPPACAETLAPARSRARFLKVPYCTLPQSTVLGANWVSAQTSQRLSLPFQLALPSPEAELPPPAPPRSLTCSRGAWMGSFTLCLSQESEMSLALACPLLGDPTARKNVLSGWRLKNALGGALGGECAGAPRVPALRSLTSSRP